LLRKIVVRLEVPLLGVPAQGIPVLKCIQDGSTKRTFGQHGMGLNIEPGLERVEYGNRLSLPLLPSFFITEGADVPLDPVELLDKRNRHVGSTGMLHDFGDFHEFATGVNKAGHLFGMATRKQPVIAGERIGLHVAAEIGQSIQRPRLASTSGKLIGHQRFMPPAASRIDP
jgi:hypothetical protein